MSSGSMFANNCGRTCDQSSAPLSMCYPKHEARMLPTGSWCLVFNPLVPELNDCSEQRKTGNEMVLY